LKVFNIMKLNKKIAKWLMLGAVLLLGAAAVLMVEQNKKRLPDMDYTSLKGEAVSRAALQGQVVLVNFWATDCTGCVAEMAEFKAIQADFPALKVLAVAMDYDQPSYINEFVQKRALPFTIIHDTGGVIAQAYGGVDLVPTTLLFDKQGRQLKRYLGSPVETEAQTKAFRAVIAQALSVP
jgi:peroxiredoxin